MKRKLASRLHLAGPLLALLLVSLNVLSCGKDAAPLKPSQSAMGSGHAHGSGPPAPGFEFVKTEAIVTLASGASLNDYLTGKNVHVVITLTLPAAGSFPARTYYLIHTIDGSDIDLTTLTANGAQTVSRHNLTWMPEDDRGGLPFDDHDSWRSGTGYLTQPAISKVKIPQARAITEGLNEKIAILDTGIDGSHPLFASIQSHIIPALNYTVLPPAAGVEDDGNGEDDDNDGEKDDGVGHGTHVTGIVYTGARKATFVIYKVLDDEGRGTAFGLAQALKDAADYGVHVINLSLGLTGDDDMIHHAIDYCVDRGIAVVASAGNRASDEIQYPAAYDGVISVTAVDNQDVKAEFASFGSTVDISAPGVDIISPIPGYFGVGKYAIASGSSMATAFVSAAIALNDLRETLLTPQEAEGSVLNGAIDITEQNPGKLLGSGRVDLYNSVHHPLQMP